MKTLESKVWVADVSDGAQKRLGSAICGTTTIEFSGSIFQVNHTNGVIQSVMVLTGSIESFKTNKILFEKRVMFLFKQVKRPGDFIENDEEE